MHLVYQALAATGIAAAIYVLFKTKRRALFLVFQAVCAAPFAYWWLFPPAPGTGEIMIASFIALILVPAWWLATVVIALVVEEN